MKVAELQQTLQQLGRLLESAGMAKAKVEEITNFAAGLTKFQDHTLNAFTTLLGRLNEAGDVAPKTPKPRSSTAAKPPAVDVSAVSNEAKRLYDQAPAGIHEDELAALRGQLDLLKAEDLKAVAAVLEFKPTSKEGTKPKLVAAICTRIEKRAGATIRRNLLDRAERSEPANGSTNDPVPAEIP